MGFRALGVAFRVQGFGFRLLGLGLWAQFLQRGFQGHESRSKVPCSTKGYKDALHRNTPKALQP